MRCLNGECYLLLDSVQLVQLKLLSSCQGKDMIMMKHYRSLPLFTPQNMNNISSAAWRMLCWG